MIPDKWRQKMQEVCNQIWKTGANKHGKQREKCNLDKKDQVEQFLILTYVMHEDLLTREKRDTAKDSAQMSKDQEYILEQLKPYYPKSAQDIMIASMIMCFTNSKKLSNIKCPHTNFTCRKGNIEKDAAVVRLIANDNETWPSRQQIQSSEVSTLFSSSSPALANNAEQTVPLDLSRKRPATAINKTDFYAKRNK